MSARAVRFGWWSRRRLGAAVCAAVLLAVGSVAPVGAAEGVLTPTGLSASSAVGGVLLEWDAPVADSGSVTGYRILRRRTDVGEQRLSQLVRDTATTSTSYLDGSAVDGGTYVYRVRAMRGDARSAISDKATIAYEVLPVVGRTGGLSGSDEAEFEAVWSSVLTVGALAAGVPGFQNYQGPSFAQGSLSQDQFMVDGESVRVIAVFNHAGLVLGLSHELPRGFVLRSGTEEFLASDSFVQSMGVAQGRYWWPTAPMGWSVGDEVELSIAISDSGSMPQRAPAPPSAVFDQTPTAHDGVSQFDVRLLFDHANLDIDAQTLKHHALAVAGADIAEVRKYSVSKQSWIVTLQPTGPGTITITLPATIDCALPDAVCTNDRRGLRARVETTIPGSAEASLGSLDIDGAVIDPAFDPAETLHAAAAAPGASQITVTAEAAAAAQGATVSITPADADAALPGHQVALATGADTAIHITVTAPDTTTTQRYWLVVSETSAPADTTSALNSMQFTGLEPLTFDDHQNRYQLTAPPNMSHTTVVTSRADTGATVETITVRVGPDGLHADHHDADTNQPGHQVHLAETGDTLIIVRITTNDGLSQSVYLTLITQTADTPPTPTTKTTRTQRAPTPKDTTASAAPVLSSLSLTDAELSPVFASDTFEYRAGVAAAVEQVTIAAATDDADASLLIVPADTDPNTDGWQIALGAPGSDTTIVVIVNSDGKLNSYLITVSRETVQIATTLQSLSIDDHELAPVFDSATYLYAADAPAEVSEVTIRAVATDPGARIEAVPADADPNLPGYQLSLGAPGAQSSASAAFVVSAVGGTGHSTYVVSVTRAAPDPADASLRSLAVNGYGLAPAFASDWYQYQVDVPAEADSVTIDAVTASLTATATVTPADADPLQPGYQIPLGAVEQDGEPSVTTVTVGVNSQDNATTNTYTILITRAAAGPAFAHNPARDIDTLWTRESIYFPRLWSDGEVMWATHNNDFKIYAYDLETGAPLPDRNIALNNSYTRGLWSDGETMWVLDVYERALAYDLATGDRRPDSDIRYLHPYNSTVEGLWSDGEILWVSNANDLDKVFAYDFATGDRLPDYDFNGLVAAGNTGPMGLWSDGVTMWVADLYEGLFAYDLYTGDRRPSLDFDTDALSVAGIDGTWMGLWSDGETMWVATPRNNTITALNMPVSAPRSTALKSLELEGIPLPSFKRRLAQEVFVGSTITSTIVAATAAHPDATVMILPEDADSATTDHDIDLSAGANTVTVAVSNGADTSTYTVTVTQLDIPVVSDSADLVSLSVVGAEVSELDPATLRHETVVAASVDAVIVGAMPSDEYASVSITPEDADGAATGHQVNLSEGRNVIRVTVESSDRSNSQVYAVVVNRVSEAPFGWNPAKDLRAASTAGNYDPRTVWSDGETMWMLNGEVFDDTTSRAFAYDLATGDRRAARDIHLAAANDRPSGMWSDGQTLWVSDTWSRTAFAYDLATGDRRAVSDIHHGAPLPTPVTPGHAGLWSDGETLWISYVTWSHITPTWKFIIGAYDLATGSRRPNRDFVPADNPWISGFWSDGSTVWVSDFERVKLFAYDFATGARLPSLDFNTLRDAENHRPLGLWSDGTTMWVADYAADRVFAYNMPTDE